MPEGSKLSGSGMSSLVDAVNRKDSDQERMYLLGPDVPQLHHNAFKCFENRDVAWGVGSIRKMEEIASHDRAGSNKSAKSARKALTTMWSIIDGHNIFDPNGLPLISASQGMATGRLFLLGPDQGGDNIESSMRHLQDKFPNRRVILVTNLASLHLQAREKYEVQDYKHGRILSDGQLMPRGIHQLPENFWTLDVEKEDNSETLYQVRGDVCRNWRVNEAIYWANPDHSLDALVVEKDSDRALIRRTMNYRIGNRKVCGGIVARNREQNFLFNMMLHTTARIQTICGSAGTGKSYCVLAAGAELMSRKLIDRIVVTRLRTALNEEGKLLEVTGDATEKMMAWMGCTVTAVSKIKREMESQRIHVPGFNLGNRIEVIHPDLLAGESLERTLLFCDEAQSLSFDQVDAIGSRIDGDSWAVFAGNLKQIPDTEHARVDEDNSGLAMLVKNMAKLGGDPLYAHIILEKNERGAGAELMHRVSSLV